MICGNPGLLRSNKPIIISYFKERKETRCHCLPGRASYQAHMQTSLSEKTLTDRLFGWWYAISTPPPPPDNAPLRLRESLSKIKFVSIILLIEIILSIADYATAFAYG